MSSLLALLSSPEKVDEARVALDRLLQTLYPKQPTPVVNPALCVTTTVTDGSLAVATPTVVSEQITSTLNSLAMAVSSLQERCRIAESTARAAISVADRVATLEQSPKVVSTGSAIDQQDIGVLKMDNAQRVTEIKELSRMMGAVQGQLTEQQKLFDTLRKYLEAP